MERSCFTFDLNKCVGCHACSVACYNENETFADIPWREISTYNAQKYPELPVFYYSLACNHCEEAPCMKNCPALAYTRNEETGAILHHADKCIGCQYCTWACPYDAPKYLKKEGIVSKCTFCLQRLENVQKPACTNLCPTGALDYAAIEPKETILSQGFINRGIGPAIEIKELRKNDPPQMDQSLFPKEYVKNIIPVFSKISARHEWALIIFTLLVPFLYGMFWRICNHAEGYGSYVFSIAGFLATIFSMLHLGRKGRAWRSVLNIKNSWLSREILFFSLFFGLALIHLYFFHNRFVIGATMLFGTLTLLSIDKIYYLTEKKHPVSIHSSMVLFTGTLVIVMLYGFQNMAIILLIFKMGLYMWRKVSFIRNRIYFNKILAFIRMLFILVSFVTIWLDEYHFAIVAVMAGEIIDRIEFYNEMDVITPQKELNRLLQKHFR